MKNIPNHIIDLKTPFEQLKEEDKKLVLQLMSKQEYDAYFETSNTLKQNAQIDVAINHRQKEQLMHAFIHKQQLAKPIWDSSVPLWKAAAIFILLGAGWLLHWQSYHHKKIEYVTQLDTVYLEKEVPVKVFDTVYYKDENETTYAIDNRNFHKQHSHEITTQQKDQKKELPEYTHKGVSAKDDSLIQSFKFVTL